MSTFFSLQLRPKRGFTLIELMIAVSIIAILSAIGLVTYSSARMIARDAKRKADLKAIAQALELFYTEYNRYPCSGNGAVNQSSANWLSDSNLANCVSNGVAGTNTNLAPTYMSSVPKDPSSTGSYVYSYYSSGINPWGSCGIHDFILWTQLENPNDSERASKNPRTICTNVDVVTNFTGSAYIIKMP